MENKNFCDSLNLTDEEKTNLRKNLEEFYGKPLHNFYYDANVGKPAHYNSHPSGIECIDVTRHYCFSIGNAIKYLWRAGLKKEQGKTNRQKEIEDLQKAIWYINDRIKELQNEQTATNISISKGSDFDIDKLRKDDSKQ